MPAASSVEVPARDASSTLTGMIFASGAIPEPPMPLLARAAMIPATCVPWPSSSETFALWSTMFAPCTSSTKPLASSSTPLPAISPGFVHRFAARSGWSSCMPVSRTATTIPAPVDCDHASWAPSASEG